VVGNRSMCARSSQPRVSRRPSQVYNEIIYDLLDATRKHGGDSRAGQGLEIKVPLVTTRNFLALP
jgi:hypothetical protein